MRSLLILMLLLGFAASGPATAGDGSGGGEQNLLVFYSNDVLGETEPCG